MRMATCEACHKEVSLSGMLLLRGTAHCEPCADEVIRNDQGAYGRDDVERCIDPTLCGLCGADGGEREFERIGRQPTCPACARKIRSRPLPVWLRFSFAGLLALLAYALLTGARYYPAARDFERAKTFSREGRHLAASQLLDGVLRRAPDSSAAAVLKIKSDFLSGNPLSAFERIESFGNREGDEEAVAEINAILDRVTKAGEQLERARKAFGADDAKAALALGREAAALYPESPQIRLELRRFEASVAFDEKDYDRFLGIQTSLAAEFPSLSIPLAGLASALACKFAITGEPSFRAEAEKYLSRAEAAAREEDSLEEFREYAERIRHRLESREILSKKEYDLRFRPGKEEPPR